MNRQSYNTALRNEMMPEQPAAELQVYAHLKVASLKDWGKLFATADTTLENEFNDWDATLGEM